MNRSSAFAPQAAQGAPDGGTTATPPPAAVVVYSPGACREHRRSANP